MKGYSLIDDNLRNNLSKIQIETQKIIKKLVNNEFEIAIVGLEKAGKSSFCNALIENNMLPTDEERCTYTATSIISSENSSAEVRFLTKQEFERDLRDKLSKLGIENPNSFSLTNINLVNYESEYEKVDPEKKALYDATLNQEIRDIIEHKNTLSSYLDRSPEKFSENNSEFNKYITAPERAMAVKEVIITSPLLNKMPNAIIYDVPGFNSPTEMHLKQTKEKMNSADAIIMIAAADEPSITAPELNVIKEVIKDTDTDGTLLSDKLFVYANKADRSEKLNDNISKIYKQWGETHKILFDKSRFFFGSANAYLQRLGKIESRIDYSNGMIDNLSNLDNSNISVKTNSSVENGFGIISIRNALEEYNKTTRIKVLQGRVGRLQSKLNELLSPIMDQFTDDDIDAIASVDGVLVAKYVRDFTENVTKGLDEYRENHKTDVIQNKPLSDEMAIYIQNEIVPEKYSELINQKVDEAKKKLNIVADNKGTMNVAEIETEARKSLFSQMYEEDFAEKMAEIVSNQHQESYNEILNIILKKLGVNNTSKYFNSIKEKVCDQLAPFICSVYSENYYRSLIERYSRDLYELLIGQRYAEERYQRFLGDISGYFSMSVFYDDTIPSSEAMAVNKIGKNFSDGLFCRQLLCHNLSVPKINSTIEELKNKVASCLRTEELPESLVSIIISIARNDMISAGAEIINVLKRIPSDENETNRIAYAKQALNDLDHQYSTNKTIYNADITDEEEFSALYHGYFNSSRNYDDVIQYIKEDIDILKDIMLHCFVRALNLEKPFVAREYLIIEEIKKYIRSDEFYDFIGKTIPMILPEKYEQIKTNQLEREMNIACRKEIMKIMDTMKTA